MRIGVGNSSHGAIPAMENAMDQRRHAEKEADDAGRSVPCLIGVIRTSIVVEDVSNRHHLKSRQRKCRPLAQTRAC